MAVSSRAIPEKRPASSAGERRAIRLSAMRVSIDRISLTGTSGSICRTTFCSVNASDSGGKLVRTATKKLDVNTEDIRIINRALGFVFREPRLFHPADNADDGECFGILSRFGAVPQALANRAAVSASSIGRSLHPQRRLARSGVNRRRLGNDPPARRNPSRENSRRDSVRIVPSR